MPLGIVDDALGLQFADVTRTRFAAGSIVAGSMVPGASSTATIRASVQPMPSSEQQDLPTAVRARGVVRVFSVSSLQTVDERTLLIEDEIAHAGEQWRVLMVDVWTFGGLDHYDAVAARVER